MGAQGRKFAIRSNRVSLIAPCTTPSPPPGWDESASRCLERVGRAAAQDCCNQLCEDPEGDGRGPRATLPGSWRPRWALASRCKLEQREAGVCKSTLIQHMGCEIFISVRIVVVRG